MALCHILPMRIDVHNRILAHMCARIFAVGAFSRTRMAIPNQVNNNNDDGNVDYIGEYWHLSDSTPTPTLSPT